MLQRDYIYFLKEKEQFEKILSFNSDVDDPIIELYRSEVFITVWASVDYEANDVLHWILMNSNYMITTNRGLSR